MKEITLSCPFTGCAFSTTEDKDGNLYIVNPLENKVRFIRYDHKHGFYQVPKELFKPVETVTMTQAAEILGVSRQRVSAIAANDTIPAKTVNGQTVFMLEDVLEYKETRKPGAPRKDDNR